LIPSLDGLSHKQEETTQRHKKDGQAETQLPAARWNRLFEPVLDRHSYFPVFYNGDYNLPGTFLSTNHPIIFIEE
jgi:hypothetical protein